MRQRGILHQTAVVTLTIAALVAYGAALKWGIETGNWPWVFPLGLIATAALYFLVTDKRERNQGNAEMAKNFRRWKSKLTGSRPR